jgi:hypothetical protein
VASVAVALVLWVPAVTVALVLWVPAMTAALVLWVPAVTAALVLWVPAMSVALLLWVPAVALTLVLWVPAVTAALLTPVPAVPVPVRVGREGVALERGNRGSQVSGLGRHAERGRRVRSYRSCSGGVGVGSGSAHALRVPVQRGHRIGSAHRSGAHVRVRLVGVVGSGLRLSGGPPSSAPRPPAPPAAPSPPSRGLSQPGAPPPHKRRRRVSERSKSRGQVGWGHFRSAPIPESRPDGTRSLRALSPFCFGFRN